MVVMTMMAAMAAAVLTVMVATVATAMMATAVAMISVLTVIGMTVLRLFLCTISLTRRTCQRMIVACDIFIYYHIIPQVLIHNFTLHYSEGI